MSLPEGNWGIEVRSPDQLPCLLQVSRTVLLVVLLGDEVLRAVLLKSLPAVPGRA